MKDARHLVTRRYLRQLYPDPMTGQALVPLIAPQGGIWGVASASKERPIRAALPRGVVTIEHQANTYSDWRFTYLGGQ
ncbi:hypothetical protein GmRootV512_07040 [Variovorax sp. V512]